MPWQECNLMDERLKFIAGLLDGEKMAVLCRRFGVSRKTGYKILDRYNSCGLEGLTDRSRRPYRTVAALISRDDARGVASDFDDVGVDMMAHSPTLPALLSEDAIRIGLKIDQRQAPVAAEKQCRAVRLRTSTIADV
jgi:hypothetical protein